MGRQSIWALPRLVFPAGSVLPTADWEGKVLLVGRVELEGFPAPSRVDMKMFTVILR